MKVKSCIKCGKVLFEVEKGRVHKDAMAICSQCYKKMQQPANANDVEIPDILKNIFAGR